MPKITGRERVTARLRGAIGPETIEKVGQELFAGGELIRAEAHRSISEGSISGKHHVPSLPGEPPNRDTGVLQAHIETTQPAPLRVEVSSNAPYAVPLEAGSERKAGVGSRSFSEKSKKHGPVRMEWGDSKTAARPYMGPASRKKKKEVVALVRKAVSDAIKR